ncbi:MAG TPA: GNAT family N-acetyltransferase [Blastocatellia bacterium]|nr:GNAT family N-acetyltransferase [Blastocatellia bacterium]
MNNSIFRAGRDRNSSDPVHFSKYIPELGEFNLRPLRISEDLPTIHDWVNREYARYWGMVGHSREAVQSAYEKILTQAQVFIGFYRDQPAFLLECYWALEDQVGKYYEAQPGDYGMHILVAPTNHPLSDFTWHVFTVILDFMFSDSAVDRIVVEPDVRNEKIHVLNRRAGFEYQKVIELPNKTAYLAFCTRKQYGAALKRRIPKMKASIEQGPEQTVAHLQPELWNRVNTLHIRKAISEFAHELLIEPRLQYTKDGWGHYVLATDPPGIEYRFRAQILSLDHWHIDPDSIGKFDHNQSVPLDSLSFIIEFSETLGISASVLPTYLEEITSTLYGSAYKHAREGLSAVELTRADFQEVEHAMMEGHPSFVANNGRIGFDAIDYRAYAPEAAAPVSLVWLAAHKSRAAFTSIRDLTYQELLQQELDVSTLQSFNQKLKELELDPDSYILVPVHPWQWHNKLAMIFAPDLAARNLVCLGPSRDQYLPQQSIRTFFNVSQPHRCYVKTSLSILNMGFMRGLSPYYMRTTPEINEWIHELIQGDAYLRQNGFGILRELATVGYRNFYYENAVKSDSPYKKMLAALWRESPIPKLRPGQRLMTMASLLHLDRDGRAVLPELIKSSGLATADWIRRYLASYLSPLLHCFYAHDLVFMPHGENLILVLENNVPVRAIMKDIAEEAAILNTEVVLPDNVKRLSVSVPEELKVLSIFTDVFDCIFRYISHILVEHGDFPEDRFWELVAESIREYQLAQPQLREKFERYDLFAPEFIKSCLNRLQLGNNQQMIDLADPAKNLKFAGTLKNPVAAFKSAVFERQGQSA